jgi:hypothetical protein
METTSLAGLSDAAAAHGTGVGSRVGRGVGDGGRGVGLGGRVGVDGRVGVGDGGRMVRVAVGLGDTVGVGVAVGLAVGVTGTAVILPGGITVAGSGVRFPTGDRGVGLDGGAVGVGTGDGVF